MDEWLKIHTYIVCSTKSLAKLKMIDDWNNIPIFQLDESLWNIHRSQNKIDSPFSVYKYVGLNQVLNYFDGIDNVDKFRIDESASSYSLSDIKKAVEILGNAGKKRDIRSKQWAEWCRENDCKE
ncbi:hypothetical protein LMB76_04145 [Limosilactobacillus reuteri]|uniref:Uncharacterized protein n=1 Tax=Limosilactobacillus reuteri TaxID=1598 RepID=A0AAW4X4U4_LIMRT|nr:hypothetical protein [Limosilactobacillus reuteri]MCC4477410.1 hypothetical protein [Limosilactobacillus reuteri]MCC4479687.1 hypothetical protein [Limosilactobacillus reuteri]MCC4489007.1 hypothetical protein [Limosilactobacillus reuteri]MCC4493294.1 hypothetical protein [Limosilactobacillus reuteri]MCC4496034.1 hypothetical protein [Limosilactobacillus reuteri]